MNKKIIYTERVCAKDSHSFYIGNIVHWECLNRLRIELFNGARFDKEKHKLNIWQIDDLCVQKDQQVGLGYYTKDKLGYKQLGSQKLETAEEKD